MDLPFWTAIPFTMLLGAIAVMPAVHGHWWHQNRNRALVVAVLALPVAAYLLWQSHGTRRALGHELVHYGSFLALLGPLYVVSGGIALRGDIPGTPRANLAVLALGVVLANFVGTTGAAMVLVRPFLRANARRARQGHLPVFFIFVVCNTAGLLTPLGDPPLFLGFLNGVGFFWTLKLLPQWAMVNGVLLAMFYAADCRAMRRDAPPDPAPAGKLVVRPVLVGLKLNGPLLALIVVMVLGQKVLPWLLSEFILLWLAAISWYFTPPEARAINRFTFEPINEVAILFLGIFVTMVPALLLLDEHGHKLGLTTPAKFFWVTGILSSLLDNAPTYLTLSTVASGGRGLPWLAEHRPDLLAAVSCGAVFLGAGSYIGNGPNFMVKAIAEETGYAVPSFFGYLLRAVVVLGPIYVLLTWLFFAR